MSQRLRGHVGDQGGHEELENACDQLVRPPGPEILGRHGPRVALVIVTARLVSQSEHLSQSVHVQVAIPLHSLVTGQEFGSQDDRGGRHAAAATQSLIVARLLPPRKAVHTEHAVELEGGHQKSKDRGDEGDADGAQKSRTGQATRQRSSVDVQGGQRGSHRLGLQTLGSADGRSESSKVSERQGQ